MFDILPAQMLRPKRAATGPIDTSVCGNAVQAFVAEQPLRMRRESIFSALRRGARRISSTNDHQVQALDRPQPGCRCSHQHSAGGVGLINR